MQIKAGTSLYSNLPKLVHSYTSLFLLLLDRLKICTVKLISNSLIQNLLKVNVHFFVLFNVHFYDDSDSAVAA